MEKTSFTGDSDSEFRRDVVRAKFLSHYAAGWDQPVLRKVFTHADEPPLEVYQFGREGIDKVARVATIGAAEILAAAGKPRLEFLMVLPLDLGGAQFDEVAGFLMDFTLFARDSGVQLRDGYTTPDSPLIPKPWKQQAVLAQSPLGESEAFEHVHLGPEPTHILWVVPIYSSERDLIRNKGIDAFDRLSSRSDLSLADVRRPPLVQW